MNTEEGQELMRIMDEHLSLIKGLTNAIDRMSHELVLLKRSQIADDVATKIKYENIYNKR